MRDTTELNTRMAAALAKHGWGVLQISGGKDSLACYELLRPFADRLIVMWVDTGDAPAEIQERMAAIAREHPRFVVIAGNKEQVVADYGLPTDLLPAQCSPLGLQTTAGAPAMQSRYDCCARSMWLPAAHAIDTLGATLVIRGQKATDALKPATSDGDSGEGFELLHPLEGWTDQDVFDYLADAGVELPSTYKFSASSIDCCTCTAYTEEAKRVQYVRQYEPAKFDILRARMNVIASWVLPNITAFATELAETKK